MRSVACKNKYCSQPLFNPPEVDSEEGGLEITGPIVKLCFSLEFDGNFMIEIQLILLCS